MNKCIKLPLVLIGALVLSVARAQGVSDYPTKIVSVIAGFPPGTATDTVTRVLCERLTARLGRTFIVDNWPGQGGIQPRRQTEIL